MAEFFKQGECIDGHRVLIITRKLDFKSFNAAPTGFKGMKYNCSLNSKSVIDTPLSQKSIDTAQNKKTTVHCAQGDSLNCSKMFFIAETSRKLNCFRVTMMSGQHECSQGKPDTRVYAEIQTPFEHIVHASEKKLQKLGQKDPLLLNAGQLT